MAPALQCGGAVCMQNDLPLPDRMGYKYTLGLGAYANTDSALLRRRFWPLTTRLHATDTLRPKNASNASEQSAAHRRRRCCGIRAN